MKRMICMILILAMCFVFSSCNNSDAEQNIERSDCGGYKPQNPYMGYLYLEESIGHAEHILRAEYTGEYIEAEEYDKAFFKPIKQYVGDIGQEEFAVVFPDGWIRLDGTAYCDVGQDILHILVKSSKEGDENIYYSECKYNYFVINNYAGEEWIDNIYSRIGWRQPYDRAIEYISEIRENGYKYSAENGSQDIITLAPQAHYIYKVKIEEEDMLYPPMYQSNDMPEVYDYRCKVLSALKGQPPDEEKIKICFGGRVSGGFINENGECIVFLIKSGDYYYKIGIRSAEDEVLLKKYLHENGYIQ